MPDIFSSVTWWPVLYAAVDRICLRRPLPRITKAPDAIHTLRPSAIPYSKQAPGRRSPYGVVKLVAVAPLVVIVKSGLVDVVASLRFRLQRRRNSMPPFSQSSCRGTRHGLFNWSSGAMDCPRAAGHSRPEAPWWCGSSSFCWSDWSWRSKVRCDECDDDDNDDDDDDDILCNKNHFHNKMVLNYYLNFRALLFSCFFE